MFPMTKQPCEFLPSQTIGGLMGDTEEELVRLRLVFDTKPTDLAELPAAAALQALADEGAGIEGKNDAKLNLHRQWPHCEYRIHHGGRKVVVTGDVRPRPRLSVIKGVVSLRWTVEADVPVPMVGQLLYMIGQKDVEISVGGQADLPLDPVPPKKRGKAAKE